MDQVRHFCGRSKEDENLPFDRRYHLQTDKNSVQLVLDNVKKDDSGIYTVSARTPAGTVCRDLELRVTTTTDVDGDQPPAFLRRLNDLSVKVGTRTRFLIEIRSFSEVTVRVLRVFEMILFVIFDMHVNKEMEAILW